MNKAYTPIPVEEILHFIRSYRSLEQLPLEDGFAQLRAITPVPPANEYVMKDTDLKELRQHFRNHWHTKDRHFGQFFLNLSHYRQIYLLNHWGIADWQDAEYLGTAQKNVLFRTVARPPAKALQLHQLLKFFENHGINPQLTNTITLTELPEFENRFGNSSNWGDYILSLASPEPLLRQLIAYEDQAYYDIDPSMFS